MTALSYIGVPTDERDLSELFDILCACQHEFVPPLCARQSSTQQALADGRPIDGRPFAYFEEMRRQHFVVGRNEDGLMVAFLTFRPRYTCPALARYGENIYMTTACVLPPYRGQGIVNRMYTLVEEELPPPLRKPYVTTRTWSTNASQMHSFLKRGYEICERIANDRGEGIDTVYFVKKIAPSAPV